MEKLNAISILFPIISAIGVFWATWTLIKYRVGKAEEYRLTDKEEFKQLILQQSEERKEAIEHIKHSIDLQVQDRKEVTAKHEKRIQGLEDKNAELSIVLAKIDANTIQHHNDITSLTGAIKELASEFRNHIITTNQQ